MVAIAAGVYHSLALKRDGTVVTWGDTEFDLDMVGGLSRVAAIAAGGSISLAVVCPTLSVNELPRTQTAEAGSTIRLDVVADGAPPLSYQWLFNGTNALSGGTNFFVEIPSVQAAQAGAYAVVVTDRFGAALTSSPAMLSVIPPVPRRTAPAVNLTGEVGSFLHLSYANTLGPGPYWQALDVVTLTQTPQLYLDTSDPLPSCRFYRAWQTNAPSIKPSLQIGLATKLTLTGAVGSNMRIDYINQFGPTDAWVTLNTVTLTNATQPYFDFTMFHQPARLYRVVPAP